LEEAAMQDGETQEVVEGRAAGAVEGVRGVVRRQQQEVPSGSEQEARWQQQDQEQQVHMGVLRLMGLLLLVVVQGVRSSER
jgi:hypothetical protein